MFSTYWWWINLGIIVLMVGLAIYLVERKNKKPPALLKGRGHKEENP